MRLEGNSIHKKDDSLFKIAQVGKIDAAGSVELCLHEDQQEEETFVVEDDIEEGAVNSQSIVVVKEAQRLECVRKGCRALFGGC